MDKKLTKAIADALFSAAQTIYEAIADIEANDDRYAKQPIQDAETAVVATDEVTAIETQPEVVTAVTDTVTAAADKVAAVVAENASYEIRLAEAMRILKGEK